MGAAGAGSASLMGVAGVCWIGRTWEPAPGDRRLRVSPQLTGSTWFASVPPCAGEQGPMERRICREGTCGSTASRRPKPIPRPLRALVHARDPHCQHGRRRVSPALRPTTKAIAPGTGRRGTGGGAPQTECCATAGAGHTAASSSPASCPRPPRAARRSRRATPADARRPEGAATNHGRRGARGHLAGSEACHATTRLGRVTPRPVRGDRTIESWSRARLAPRIGPAVPHGRSGRTHANPDHGSTGLAWGWPQARR